MCTAAVELLRNRTTTVTFHDISPTFHHSKGTIGCKYVSFREVFVSGSMYCQEKIGTNLVV